MSKRAQTISFIAMGIIFLAAIIWAFAVINQQSKQALVVDRKVALLDELYGWDDENMLSKSGGYDETDGMYHYRFLLGRNGRPYALIRYDETVDLTAETVDRLVISHPEEDPEFQEGSW